MNSSLNEDNLNQLRLTLDEGDFSSDNNLDDVMTIDIDSVIGEPPGIVIQEARPRVGDESPVPRIFIPDNLGYVTADMGSPGDMLHDMLQRQRPPRNRHPHPVRNRPNQARNHRRRLPPLPTLPTLPPMPPRYSNSNVSAASEATVLEVEKANNLTSEHSGGITLSLLNWGGLFVRTTDSNLVGYGMQGLGGQLSANFVHHSDNKVAHQEPMLLNKNGNPSRNRTGQIVGCHEDVTPLKADSSILGTTICQALMSTFIALLFLSWCFPAAFAASLNDENLKSGFPKIEQADPVAFLPIGYIYPNSETVGIRVDVAIKPIAFMALNAINLVEELETRDLFKEFQNHHPAAKEASTALLARKDMIKEKVLNLISNFGASEEWFDNPGMMKAQVQEFVQTTFINWLAEVHEITKNSRIVPDSVQSEVLESGITKFSANISSKNLKINQRVKRDFQFKLDINGLWDSAIDGLLSVFHLHSNRDMQQSVNSLVAVVKKDEKLFYQYEARVNHILELIDQSEEKAVWYSSTMDLSELVLSHAENELDLMLNHLNDFQIGKLSSYILPPKKCQEVFDSVVKFAGKTGLVTVISSPSQLLQLPASTMTTTSAFVTIIHVKLVNPVDKFHAYKVLSFPFYLPNDNNVYQFNVPDSVIGIQQAFQARHILTDLKSFKNQCNSFGETHVCNLHVTKTRSCVLNLFENGTDLCQLSKLPANQRYHPVRSEAKSYVFLNDVTEIFIKCGSDSRKFQEIGLISIEDMSGCSVETSEFIFYTRSNKDEIQLKFNGHTPKSFNSMAVEFPEDLLDKPDEPEPGSIDDLINGLIDNQPNQSSQFLEDWSPDAVGHHDWATFSMTGLSWVVIIVIVSVCLKRAFAVPMDLVPEVLGVGAIPPAADG